MFVLMYTVLCVSWFMFTDGSSAQQVTWPSGSSSGRDLRNMMLIRDGQVLILTGLNHLYSLNTTSFQLLQDIVTGPLDGTDNIMRTIIYNKTQPDNIPYITTCDSLHSYCDIRKEDDISDVVNRLEAPIKTAGVQAFMTSFQKNRREWDKFLFVACPHAEVQENRCSKPGIVWYKNSGNEKPNPWYGFKSYEDTPILTEKYVDAFVVDKYRLFFSIQYDKSSTDRKSRVAQVCQHYKPERGGKYTTRLTYVDMLVECGDLKEIQAVKKIMFGTKTVFVAVFSEALASAVCVYTMDGIKQRFVDNIKACYSGETVATEKRYVDQSRCGIYGDDYSSKSEDYFLCNEDELDTFFNVIGNRTRSLSKQPAVTYNVSLTALTVSVVDSKIIAFLGTTSGDILKAAVYPSNATNHILQPKTPNIGDMVQKDMLTSSDGKHIFALSERKVFKIPVQSCSNFSTCSGCLGSNDPFCGWCFLEERCSTIGSCPNRKWIPASSDETCPNITSITPRVMSVNKLQRLQMNISRELKDVNVSCSFHSEEVGSEFDQTQIAEVSDDRLSVYCTPTLLAVESKIKGYLNVVVTLVVNNSATTFQGNFDIFRCETFDSCINCTAEKWKCRWCAYTNECKNDDANFDYTSIANADECPHITNYTVVKEGDDPVHNSTGAVYFSRGRNYTVNITGTNLIEPRRMPNVLTYKCKLVVSETQVLWFNRTNFNQGSLLCYLNKEDMSKINSLEDEVNAKIQVTWGISPIYGETMPVIIYACEGLARPSTNCGHCKSFAITKPYYNCQWCMTRCVDSSEICNDTACGRPVITEVFPLSAHMNATTLVTVKGSNLGSVYNDIVNSVTVAGRTCVSFESGYNPGLKIECELRPSYKVMNGSVRVTRRDGTWGEFSSPFQFRVPEITAIKPSVGPMSGGTLVTVYGNQLDTGRNMTVSVGGKRCRTDASVFMMSPTRRICRTTAGDKNDQDKHLPVQVNFDGASAVVVGHVNFSYVKDPNITAISPRKSFKSGGRTLTISGENLYAIQKPKIYVVVDNKPLKSQECTRDDAKGVIYCPSPKYSPVGRRRRRRSGGTSQARIGFKMDDVSSVKAENLASSLSLLMYYEDPLVQNFTADKIYTEYLSVKGERFKVAAEKRDVVIEIGCEKCNVTSMADDLIICQPPEEEPVCTQHVKSHKFIVKVNIGFLKRSVGAIIYDSLDKQDGSGRKTEDYIIVGSVLGVLLLGLGISIAVSFVLIRKRKSMKKEKADLVYKMDKIEAKFRNQCREEFAALQTAVSDITSDLEGGNVLFRDYDVYASKTLFSSQPLRTVFTEQTQPAMDTFKGLLRNRQFLLMFIKTLEKEKTFTIHDKSNVATLLMILNHDNMEYVTDILTTLIDDLIDKNVASQTTKLLLRRSECVAEKLLTHWLSICLYHYLKERSGSALYILYKAIKIQTEKGPIDYITNCSKYTLSEDKLFTSTTEIKPVTMTLHVSHFDYIEDKEKHISVQVLDCDTVTQAKGKMLEILYKNVPYSQRPLVHSTYLEVKEDNGGSKRALHDEDASSTRDGIWKRINTLQHYGIKDGANVNLYLTRELNNSYSQTQIPEGAAPESFIVGSFRKTKPVVRTISGSNFWHLTKKHQTDGEVQLASDLCLPRLLNTKFTLQTYIDDLFQAVLSVGSEPPIIIKFLFDYLDSAALKRGIKDKDVLHTWKCNSLLLRFWVNIIKNPEFVFDVHKPLIVDSCLSVVAQTLMDSCSTADLILGPSSPSNKLLFAKDIPRYKIMVRQYFDDMSASPAFSDQDLNSYLTQKVSQKFYGKVNQSSAIIEMYKYASKYRDEIYGQMSNPEAVSSGSFSSLKTKLDSVFKSMDTNTEK